ncbi:hypothetical protein GCM10009789_87830 [Kribbella sancticallisti]|uniref:Uncharacterized protein n=1 Tax=Kribbella sancticallisti TaxID=460087 RepID=A0ABN2EX84_9ACTN
MPRGRPAPDSVHLMFWASRSLHRDLSIAATREGVTLAEFMRRATQREINRVNRRHNSKRDAA